MTAAQARLRDAITGAEAELARIDVLIGQESAQRAPGTAPSEQERALRRQRETWAEDLGLFRSDLQRLIEQERSAKRVKARKDARKALDEVIASQGMVGELAAELDVWARQGLALFDQLGAITEGRVKQILAAGHGAIPGRNEFSAQQRQSLVEWALPNARPWPAPMRFAMVVLLGQISQRIENSANVFQIAPGWQFTPGETMFSFTDAAKQQAEDLEQALQRLYGALKEPEAG